MDYDGLNMLLTYHEYVALKKKVGEEKAWLKQSKQNCEGLGINIDKVNQHFRGNVWSTDSYNPINSIWNLVGKRWLSDDVNDMAFDIMNKKYDDTICFVCKPIRIMYFIYGVTWKIHSICENSITVPKIIVALNACSDDDGAYYESDEKRRGVHWALLVIDLKNSTTLLLWWFTWLVSTNQFSKYGWIKLKQTGGGPKDKHNDFTWKYYKLSCDADNVSSDSLILQVVLPTTVMFTCVWCYCGLYGRCTLWPLEFVAYMW